MVRIERQPDEPLNLVVTGEAVDWLPAIGQIVGPRLLRARMVQDSNDLLTTIREEPVDAAVLDDSGSDDLDVLPLLRMVRRVNQTLPVVVLTRHTDRQWLENALRLAAFSVVVKPLELEEFLRQIHAIMVRLHRLLRDGHLPE